MCEAFFFPLLLVVLYLFFLGIRGYYGRKAQNSSRRRTRQERWTAATKYERGVFVVLRVALIFLQFFFIAIYVLFPLLLVWAQLHIPSLLRWIGVILGLLTFPFIAWVGRTLDKHVSGQLELREDHQLVTSGPYNRVRHPMYTTYLVFNVALILIASNLLLVLIVLVGSLLLYPRIKAEERMLIDEFGDQYRAYMMRTGMLFPRLRQRHKEKQDSS